MVEAAADGFGGHVSGWFFQGDKEADGGAFAHRGVAEVGTKFGFNFIEHSTFK